MNLSGQNFIAGKRRGADATFKARDAETGALLEPPFAAASSQDITDACTAAGKAQAAYANLPLPDRARFLRSCADHIDALGDVLTQRAMAESGLPEARLTGERGRTVGQLRLFADEVEDGAWQALRIDHGDATRTPPAPDLRLRMVPLGPVAVFGASNFPLAFSVGGGDTASALAAGCCVIVKGHPAHPGTSELVAGAITAAAAETDMPEGVFSLLNGPDNALGAALVNDPHIAAVGFTGSRAGGLALMDLAAKRAVPIPVYAEMSSVNPVVLLPERLDEAAEVLASGYVASLALGAGQFCTNPGIVLAIDGPALDRFIAATAAAVADVAGQTMLTASISHAFVRETRHLASLPGARMIGCGKEAADHAARAQVHIVSAGDFIADGAYAREVFGPSSIIVRCQDIAQLQQVLEGMEGQLTATVHMAPADYPEAARLLPVLETRAGRILANGWPTGVAVTHAMNHGGPFPATSDGRSTSVGTLAIGRFLRPVSYQDWPAQLLPPALHDTPTTALRRIDGIWTVG